MPKLSTLLIGTDSFTLSNLTLSTIYNIENLSLGNGVLNTDISIRINGFNKLKNLRFGYCSTTQVSQFTSKSNKYNKKGYNTNDYKSYYIMNCESLESIEIGERAFDYYNGEFELKKLPLLSSIVIGINNFLYVKSFLIAGKTQYSLIDMVDLPNLLTLDILDNSFEIASTFQLLNLDSIQSIYIYSRR